MYLATVPDGINQNGWIDSWLGYNHNAWVSSGEFYDMENLSNDRYPTLGPRKIRKKLIAPMRNVMQDGQIVYEEDKASVTKDAQGNVVYERVPKQEEMTVRGLLMTDGQLAYLADKTFFYGTHAYDMEAYLEDSESPQQLIRYGAYVLIFPEQAYINLTDPTDMGRMAGKYVCPYGSVTYFSMSDENAADIEVTRSEQAPENPENGAYWLCTKRGSEGLYIWYAASGSWESVAASYVKIRVGNTENGTVTIPDLRQTFSVGDAIFIENNDVVPDINEGSIIRAIGRDYILVYGYISSGLRELLYVNTTSPMSFERKLPKLDYVCVSENRVWGCHYDGKTNEIYASKLGDFKNWYVYDGITTDSYAVSVGDPGNWTGAVTYQGYPTFFKENCIIRVFGTYPAQYQTNVTTCRGVQDGSYRSLAVMGEVLIYKSVLDVCVYDGSRPVSISAALGKDKQYYDGVASASGSKYHLSMTDVVGRPFNFVYDMDHSTWVKEDGLRYIGFSGDEGGQLYAATKNAIYGIGQNTDSEIYRDALIDEQYVRWYGETGDMGFELAEHKYVKRLTIRASIPVQSEMSVYVSYDDAPFEHVGTLRGSGTLKTQNLTLLPLRCDHFKLRIEGHGDVIIYTMRTEYEIASDEGRRYAY